MSEFTVARYGTDGVGRGIWLTAHMHDWFEALIKACQQHAGFTPVIVQGAFMVRDGGGAKASEGYHDAGGCVDLNVLDLSTHQWQFMVRQCRRTGAAAWKRDRSWVHGAMAPHVHITLGSDRPLSAGAKASWAEYLAGGDGLMGDRPDYHWRPDPLVTTWPPHATQQEDDMPTAHEIAQAILDARVTNRDADGKVQGTMSVHGFLTNMEKAQDAHYQELRDEIEALRKALTDSGK